MVLCAGGLHADKHSPQPHDLPLPPAHSASSGRTERTPQHRPDPAPGRHGRQLPGKEKTKRLGWTDLKTCICGRISKCVHACDAWVPWCGGGERWIIDWRKTRRTEGVPSSFFYLNCRRSVRAFSAAFCFFIFWIIRKHSHDLFWLLL